MKSFCQFASTTLIALLLAACGGGSTPSTAVPPAETTPPVTTPPVTPPPVTLPSQTDWVQLLNHCQTPRTGLQPNGQPYTDVQGSLTDELKWLRSFIDQTYLWYQEVPTNLNMADYRTPRDYFAVLKTPLITASGRAKDRFHFTYPSAVWDAMSSGGVEITNGITWQSGTDADGQRLWIIALVEPGSPADQAGLLRGDVLVSVDGTAITDTSIIGTAALNAGLFPVTAGETHGLVVLRDGVSTLTAVMQSQQMALAPVQNVKLLSTASGMVGYLQFNDHNAVAEAALANAFATFQSAGVTDLVLDMRYNGGGYLNVASELAYMIAGPTATSGKIFEQLIGNGKLPERVPDRFRSVSSGLAPSLLKQGVSLPYLGLKRVLVLTTAATCSASESVINSLRGIDVEVDLIGGATCGKPYAFTPAPNCGTTYFAIQQRGVNNKGFGDYADGFTPTCDVADDLSRPVGDPAEGLLAAALSYRASGVCPAARSLRSRALRAAVPGEMHVVRPPVKEIAILNRQP